MVDFTRTLNSRSLDCKANRLLRDREEFTSDGWWQLFAPPERERGRVREKETWIMATWPPCIRPHGGYGRAGTTHLGTHHLPSATFLKRTNLSLTSGSDNLRQLVARGRWSGHASHCQMETGVRRSAKQAQTSSMLTRRCITAL